MGKKSIVMVCVLMVMLFSGCAMNEKIEDIGNRESLPVFKWQFGIRDLIVRNDVLDEDLIQEVNEIFEQVDWQPDGEAVIKEVNAASPHFEWDWQEEEEEDRPIPHFQIGIYEIWIEDESAIVHAVNPAEDTYAQLTKEDSEFIMTFLIGIGVAH